MTIETASRWASIWGVPLRPWAGRSPTGLVVRGVIQAGVCVFMIILLSGMLTVDAGHEGRALLRGLIVPGIVVTVLLLAVSALRAVVGVLDFVPRKQVTGTIMSVRRRRMGDFLPYVVQQAIFNRNANAIDRRRPYCEVVLHTADGEKVYVVRNSKVEAALHNGALVRLSVSPIVGYVAGVEVAGSAA